MERKHGIKRQTKIIKRAAAFLCTAVLLTMPAAAANTYAENGAKWILDGVFWVVIVLGIFGAGMSIVKRNVTAALGIIIGSALVCVLCSNPEIIVSLGNAIKGILGL